ncbi:MAG: hypothetical protein IJW62_05720, partial [Clostridia bacterium]|nr:hypothetical protein [Clostridia bacterium]
GYQETWRVSKEWYYVSEPMTYADFSSVQIGTGYEAFAAIDPTVKYDYLRQPYAPIFGFMSYRLLEDGLLVTEFEDIDPQFTDENVYIRQDAEHYRVKSMQFYPWGTEDVPDSYQILNAEAGAITFPTE